MGSGNPASGFFNAFGQGLTNLSNMTPGGASSMGGPELPGASQPNNSYLGDPGYGAAQSIPAGASPTGSPSAGTQSAPPQPSQPFSMPPAPQQPQQQQPNFTGQPAPWDIATNPTAPDFPGMYNKSPADPNAAKLTPEATQADLDQAAQEHPAAQTTGAAGTADVGAAGADTGAGSAAPDKGTAAPTIGAQSAATPGGATDQQGGQYSPYQHPQNMLQALIDLLFRGPGAFQQDLEGLNKQVGGWYGTPKPWQHSGYTRHGAGYGDQPDQTAPSQPAASPAPPISSGAGPASGPTSQAPPEAGQAPPTQPAPAATSPPTAPIATAPVQPPGTPTHDPNAAMARGTVAGEGNPAAINPNWARASGARVDASGRAPQQNPDGSATPTNGMPGGSTPNAPPPSPNYGAQQAAADNQTRPFHYTAKASVEGGGSYDAGSGGGQFGSLPYGRFHYHPGAIGSIGRRIHAAGGISDSNSPGDNTVHDTRFGHHVRAGVEVHPDVSGRLRTNGCIGIDKSKWGAFKRDLDRLSAKGPVDIINSPQGIRFVPSGVGGLPPEAAARAPTNLAQRDIAPNQISELEPIVNTTAQLAPRGIPWEQWRRSTNIDPTETPPEMDYGTGLNELANRKYRTGAVTNTDISPYRFSQMAQQLGIDDISSLDYISQVFNDMRRKSNAPAPVNPPF